MGQCNHLCGVTVASQVPYRMSDFISPGSLSSQPTAQGPVWAHWLNEVSTGTLIEDLAQRTRTSPAGDSSCGFGETSQEDFGD